jgi:NADH dehydrogenase FAD-containing subunit
MSDKTSIVIIGAGGMGVTTAKALDAKLDPAKHELTIIGSNDYYLHYPAALRAVVTAEGTIEKDMALPYDHLFGKTFDARKGRLGKFIADAVISVEEKTDAQGGGGIVVLQSGKRVEWDVLVLATGSEWNGPLRWPHKHDQLDDYLKTWREKFATAKSVVVTGAGAVGTGKSPLFLFLPFFLLP